MRSVKRAASACGLAAALVVALLAIDSATGTEAHAATVVVSVTRCATQFPVAPAPKIHVPRSLRLRHVPASSTGLVAYTNTQGYVLGPPRYRCSGGVGVDGSSSLNVWPPDQAQPVRPHSRGAGLSLTMIPVCVGCKVDLTCPYLGVMQHAARSYQVPCPGEPPRGERVHQLSHRLAAVVDPPSVRGLGWPSGRGLQASGLVGFLPGRSLQAFASSCTLPSALRSDCTDGIAAERYLIAAGLKP